MSVHIGAEKGDIAERILLPGDPLRAPPVEFKIRQKLAILFLQ